MAPTTTGTNKLTKIEDTIADTMANLLTFQKWTDTVGDIAAAKTHIRFQDFNDHADTQELLDSLPYLVVASSEDQPQLQAFAYSRDIPYGYQCNSFYDFEFNSATPANWDDDREEAIRSIFNAVGNIMLGDESTGDPGLMDVAGLDGKFAPTEFAPEPHAYAREDVTQVAVVYWLWKVQRIVEEQ